MLFVFSRGLVSVAFHSSGRELMVEALTSCCAKTVVKLTKWLVLSSLKSQHTFVFGFLGADLVSKSHDELNFFCDLTKANYLADNFNHKQKTRQP
jgi:hypothetical protein